MAAIFAELRSYVQGSSPRPQNGHKLADRYGAHSLDLYGGTSGACLFFAAYYFASKEPEAQELATQVGDKLRRQVVRVADNYAKVGSGIGGMIGLASYVYTFLRLADWLKAPKFLDSAVRIMMAITRERILRDERLDVMQGCAGAILVLLSFAQEVQARDNDSQLAIELATLCGHHLLERRVGSPGGLRAWPTVQGLPGCGFTHGAAGISYALMRLFRYTGEEAFRDAALEGFSFENALFVPREQRWLNLRLNRLWSNHSWCHGAPGIALARVASIEIADVPAIRNSMNEALDITRFLPAVGFDHLCCGNFGIIDVLHTAGSVLDRLQLSDYARELAHRVLARSNSDFILQHPDDCHDFQEKRVLPPGMFTGLSGIGYTLLRLLYPAAFPSMLLLEPHM